MAYCLLITGASIAALLKLASDRELIYQSFTFGRLACVDLTVYRLALMLPIERCLRAISDRNRYLKLNPEAGGLLRAGQASGSGSIARKANERPQGNEDCGSAVDEGDRVHRVILHEGTGAGCRRWRQFTGFWFAVERVGPLIAIGPGDAGASTLRDKSDFCYNERVGRQLMARLAGLDGSPRRGRPQI